MPSDPDNLGTLPPKCNGSISLLRDGRTPVSRSVLGRRDGRAIVAPAAFAATPAPGPTLGAGFRTGQLRARTAPPAFAGTGFVLLQYHQAWPKRTPGGQLTVERLVTLLLAVGVSISRHQRLPRANAADASADRPTGDHAPSLDLSIRHLQALEERSKTWPTKSIIGQIRKQAPRSVRCVAPRP